MREVKVLLSGGTVVAGITCNRGQVSCIKKVGNLYYTQEGQVFSTETEARCIVRHS